MDSAEPNHYRILGLETDCSQEQIRAAYRFLAKQHHPDVNAGSAEALAKTQAINVAHEILSDPKERRIYDEAQAAAAKRRRSSAGKGIASIAQDAQLRLEEFFRGSTRTVHVADPGNPAGREVYELVIPPGTAPGMRFRVRRAGGGVVIIRVLALPDFRFKIRGSDLRCDLKISCKRAEQGGEEFVSGATANRLRVKIPPGIARGEIIRISNEGLPRLRGGRGDLLVRVLYQPQVRVSGPGRR